jgi:hypothetical protein
MIKHFFEVPKAFNEELKCLLQHEINHNGTADEPCSVAYEQMCDCGVTDNLICKINKIIIKYFKEK